MPSDLEAHLRQARADRADYVVVDTPPNASATIDAAIRAADLAVIPIRPTPFDIDAAAGTIEIMRDTRPPGLFVFGQVYAAGSEDDATEVVSPLSIRRCRRRRPGSGTASHSCRRYSGNSGAGWHDPAFITTKATPSP